MNFQKRELYSGSPGIFEEPRRTEHLSLEPSNVKTLKFVLETHFGQSNFCMSFEVAPL